MGGGADKVAEAGRKVPGTGARQRGRLNIAGRRLFEYMFPSKIL